MTENDPLDIINEQDTREMFANLLGQIVINHEKINTLLDATIFIIRRKLNLWKTLSYDRSTSIGSDPLNKHFVSLSDSDLRVVFCDHICVWQEVCSNLWEHPSWFSKFSEVFCRCVTDENEIRNHLLHSSFSFDEGNTPLEQMKSLRKVRGFGKKRGQVEVTTVDRSSLLEFTEFQANLVNFLENFAEDQLEEDFDFNVPYVLLNREKFSDEIIKYAELVLEIWKGFGWDPKENSDWSNTESDYRKQCSELYDLDIARKKLKIKSKNVEYVRNFY